MTEPTSRILIVDDEKNSNDLVNDILQQSGYVTTQSSSSDEALKMLSTAGFELVLLDLNMPGISGLETLKQIRSNGMDSAVIIMTGHGSEETVADCMKNGADDYIAKPFTERHLLKVEQCLVNRRERLARLQAEKEKEDFFLMLSHDLKNPLTAALGSIDIMREGRLGPINDEQADYLQSAVESCEEIIAMVDNLLDLQRFKSERIQTRIKKVNPNGLIETVIRRFSPAAEREHIALSFNCHCENIEISVDANLMLRAITNIVANAIKFTYEEGTINIDCAVVADTPQLWASVPEYAMKSYETSTSGELVCISITDSGGGIHPDDLCIIFDQYVQSSRSVTRARGGAGLGLAFCKLAVENFKGCIWAESRDEHGSTFKILLPAFRTAQG